MSLLLICSTHSNDHVKACAARAFEQLLAGAATGAKAVKGELQVISSWPDYQAYDFKGSRPELILIQPELDWPETGRSNYGGYQVAYELITRHLEDHFFNLQFISSLSRSMLAGLAKPRHKSLVDAFFHLHTLEEAPRPQEDSRYSPLHFSLMKALLTEDINRLNYVAHQVESIKGRLSAANIDRPRIAADIAEQLSELEMFNAVATGKLAELGSALKKGKTAEDFFQIINELQLRIEYVRIDLTGRAAADAGKAAKSSYKVVIIEDEPHYRAGLSEIFRAFYHEVYPGSAAEIERFEISAARELISQRSDTDVFILDLLYKDQEKHWLTFNGLDLYQQIQQACPYAAIRIISNLPGNIVAGISTLLRNPVPLSHVIPKQGTMEDLRQAILERVREINYECAENEKKKSLFKPIPDIGVFSWPGVRNFMYYLITKRPEDFASYQERAFMLLREHQNKKLHLHTDGWKKGQLIKPEKKSSITNQYVEDRLTVIFTHRLIVISEALKNEAHVIDKQDFTSSVLSRICSISNFDKLYFYKTGLHQKWHEDEERKGYQVQLTRLFPHEYQLLHEHHLKTGQLTRQRKLSRYPQLYSWVKGFLSRPAIIRHWTLLELDFSPYAADPGAAEPQNIDHNLTIGQLESYLVALILRFSIPAVEDMIAETLSDCQLDRSWKIPEDTYNLIDDLFSK